MGLTWTAAVTSKTARQSQNLFLQICGSGIKGCNWKVTWWDVGGTHRPTWFIWLLACWWKTTQLAWPFLSAAPGSQMSDLFHLEVQREQTNSLSGCCTEKERLSDLQHKRRDVFFLTRKQKCGWEIKNIYTGKTELLKAPSLSSETAK